MYNLLFICFNRPDLTKRSLKQLLSLNWDNIIIYIDGARNEDEVDHVNEVIFVVEELTKDILCNVKIIKREVNYGCRRNVEHALNYFFKIYKNGWVFEDDILINDINMFNNLRKNWTKKGHLGLFNPVKTNGSAPFEINNGYYLIWGWYLNSDETPDFRKRWSIVHFWKILKTRTFFKGIRFCYTYFQTLLNGVDTWDSLYSNWAIQNAIPSYVCHIPFVENIGFDDRATHTIYCSLKNTENVISVEEWEKYFNKNFQM